jgi:hypothetical protein
LDEEVQPSNRAKICLEFGPVNDHWIQSSPEGQMKKRDVSNWLVKMIGPGADM